MKIEKPADRLIVAADFQPPARDMSLEDLLRWVEGKVLELADDLSDTGVYLKVNSVARACGYGLLNKIRERGLRRFGDYKLYDIASTLANDGGFLSSFAPELLTVACDTGVDAMTELKKSLPNTELLGVTVLTSIKEGDKTLADQTIESRVMDKADMALEAGIDGIIASPKELAFLRGGSFIAARWDNLSMNIPGIRPAWSIVEGDDQNPDRVMTPADAIRAGADRIVIGRPITGSKDRRAAVLRTLEEIESATVSA